ncbi:MAG: hypothetical protein ACJ779_06650 [Chloroflexota bacterium]
MESGYEVEPERIGRETDRRRPAAALVIAAIVVAAVLLKPWDQPKAPSAVVVPSTAPAAAVISPPPVGLDGGPLAAEPVASPTWPSARNPSLLAAQTSKEAEGALGSLVEHAGTWGIGTAGVGPRMLREEPWSDWTPATAEIVNSLPVHVASWPDTDLCAGYPTIYDQPTLVAITTPQDVAPDRVLRGWWTDGANVAPLAGSVVQISPPGNRGIGYLERLDQAPWPRGRYEFHVVAGDRSVSMTVCLTRRG